MFTTHVQNVSLVFTTTANVVTVAAMMGHASLDTTALYTQPSEEDMAEAVETG